ncbi:Abi family protein [Arthrobacter alkaliphilus]|uniref:Abi family protein n=1 Tax=Arthrobacter alkaliphilus TaxID=369936 RepID=UPI001F308327|nr:Abi family protein [Arthrobacter alkaliphilus]
MRYEKPALSLVQQLEQLRSRGLLIPDESKALRYLARIGYYRLSPYMIPHQLPGGAHRFRSGADFDGVLQLYIFDRRLRLLIMDALERFEVALRATLSNHMSLKGAGPFWYLDPSHFQRQADHDRLLEDLTKARDDEKDRLERDLQRLQEHPPRNLQRATEDAKKQSFMRHYLSASDEPSLPPSWMMIEMLSFGDLMYLYRNIADREDRKEIARQLGITDELLSSWLGTFQYTRNLCAHHGRVWNRQFGVAPRIPRSAGVAWLADTEIFRGKGTYRRSRVFPVLVALQTVLGTISPGSGWASRLRDLLAEFDSVPLNPMGFPPDWHSDEFWQPYLP